MAVGVKVKEDEFFKFKEKIIELAKESNISKLAQVIEIEQEVSIDDITKKDVEGIAVFEPFGEANRNPCFAFKNLKIDSIRSLTEGKHLKLLVKSDKNNYINAIGFNMGEKVQEFKIGDRIDLAGNLEINTFGGVENIQINLKDVIKSV